MMAESSKKVRVLWPLFGFTTEIASTISDILATVKKQTKNDKVEVVSVLTGLLVYADYKVTIAGQDKPVVMEYFRDSVTVFGSHQMIITLDIPE